MSEWLAMGGYGWFVWGSYGVTFAAVAIELLALRARARSALETAQAETETG
jgi:heme exporter protein D